MFWVWVWCGWVEAGKKKWVTELTIVRRCLHPSIPSMGEFSKFTQKHSYVRRPRPDNFVLDSPQISPGSWLTAMHLELPVYFHNGRRIYRIGSGCTRESDEKRRSRTRRATMATNMEEVARSLEAAAVKMKELSPVAIAEESRDLLDKLVTEVSALKGEVAKQRAELLAAVTKQTEAIERKDVLTAHFPHAYGGTKEPKGVLSWTLKDFSARLCDYEVVRSRLFEFVGCTFYLSLYPRGNGEGRDKKLTFYLSLSDGSETKIKSSVSILEHAAMGISERRDARNITFEKSFNQSSPYSGVYLTTLDNLHQDNHGYLRHGSGKELGSLILRITLTVLK